MWSAVVPCFGGYINNLYVQGSNMAGIGTTEIQSTKISNHGIYIYIGRRSRHRNVKLSAPSLSSSFLRQQNHLRSPQPFFLDHQLLFRLRWCGLCLTPHMQQVGPSRSGFQLPQLSILMICLVDGITTRFGRCLLLHCPEKAHSILRILDAFRCVQCSTKVER